MNQSLFSIHIKLDFGNSDSHFSTGEVVVNRHIIDGVAANESVDKHVEVALLVLIGYKCHTRCRACCRASASLKLCTVLLQSSVTRYTKAATYYS